MTEKNIYRFTNALLLFICCLFCVQNITEAKTFAWGSLFLGGMILVLLTAWCSLQQKGRVVLVLSVLAVLAGAFVVAGREVFAAELMKGNVVIGAIAFGCFVLEFICTKMFGVRIVLALAGMGWLFYDLFTDRDLTHMSVVFVLFYVALVYVEWTERHWDKKRIVGQKHYMVRIMPFMVVYLVLMGAMSAPKDPYDWQFLKDAYVKVREVILDISRNVINGNREDFDYGNSGFDGESKLLGSISDEDKTLMKIKGHAGLKTNVYLMGKVYDRFTGDGWESTDTVSVDERQLDGLETLSAVRAYDPLGEEKYIERTGLYVSFDDFRSCYLFAPLKTVRMQNLENTPYVSEGGNYLFEQTQGYGLEYNLTFVQLNVDHPVFYEFLEQKQITDAEVFKQVQSERLKKTVYSMEDLEEHRNRIASVYGERVMLSDETAKWVDKHTAGASTDIQRLKAIEAALQQMEYTRTPGHLPKEVDSESAFLDYFLIESRQGYCVHYASAFVMLARAEGFPARYVEGFSVPVPGRHQVHVKSDMAHVWPEVYIKGVGWIPFEPTPGYAEVRYTPWEIVAKEPVLGNDKEAVPGKEPVQEQEEEVPEPSLPELEVADESVDFRFAWPIIGLTILVALVLTVLLWCGEVYFRYRRFRKSDLETRFLLTVQTNLRLLRYLGYARMECETLAELRKRAWAVLDGEEGGTPEFMFLLYYQQYLYGQYAVTEEMADVVLKEKKHLLHLLHNWKPAAYFYCRLKVF